MTNLDIVYLILVIILVSIIIIGVIAESIHLLLERKELRELRKIKYEFEKKVEEFNKNE